MIACSVPWEQLREAWLESSLWNKKLRVRETMRGMSRERLGTEAQGEGAIVAIRRRRGDKLVQRRTLLDHLGLLRLLGLAPTLVIAVVLMHVVVQGGQVLVPAAATWQAPEMGGCVCVFNAGRRAAHMKADRGAGVCECE